MALFAAFGKVSLEKSTSHEVRQDDAFSPEVRRKDCCVSRIERSFFVDIGSCR
jgi:hypothetical protein